jgi:hypothetical protein
MPKSSTNAVTKYKLSFLPNSVSCNQWHGGWVQIQVTMSTSVLAVTVIVRHLLQAWRQRMAWHTTDSEVNYAGRYRQDLWIGLKWGALPLNNLIIRRLCPIKVTLRFHINIFIQEINYTIGVSRILFLKAASHNSMDKQKVDFTWVKFKSQLLCRRGSVSWSTCWKYNLYKNSMVVFDIPRNSDETIRPTYKHGPLWQ